MIRRLLAYPSLIVFLFATWLLLNQSVSAGHVVLGIMLAFGGAWILIKLEAPALRLRKPRTILVLTITVLCDIVRSNIAVARIILGPRPAGTTSGFIDIPLELRDPYGLAALAIIITSTPGTLWVSFESDTGILTIHVLDLVDENEWIMTIKERYERRLMEIFE